MDLKRGGEGERETYATYGYTGSTEYSTVQSQDGQGGPIAEESQEKSTDGPERTTCKLGGVGEETQQSPRSSPVTVALRRAFLIDLSSHEPCHRCLHAL